MTLDLGRFGRRSPLRHVQLVAVLASTGLLVGIVLSALPRETIPPPFSAGYQQDAGARERLVTDEAEAVFREMEDAGLPVENAVSYTRRGQDPEGLLGLPDGYRSKVTFEDLRIDGGAVAVADPGSVQLGGAIEVFHGAGAARARAERLRGAASHLVRAEYVYLSGRVLLRVSPYLRESAADGYAAAIDGAPFPGPPTVDPNLRTV